MSAGLITILVSLGTWLVMLAGFFLARHRRLHIIIMVSVIVYDLLIPIYLYIWRDWYTRLITHQDILTFGVWMHFGLVLTLYVLYVFQITSARGILRHSGDALPRREHRSQGIMILAVRALVISTGALLWDPVYED